MLDIKFINSINKSLKFFILTTIFYDCFGLVNYDINIIGILDDKRSISRHTTSFLQTLSHDFNINLILTSPLSSNSDTILPKSIQVFDISEFEKKSCNNNKLSGITIHTTELLKTLDKYREIQNNSIISAVYSVTETTKVRSSTVKAINKYFDVLIVPDPWLVDVYENSGVCIPVFSLPLALDLQCSVTREKLLRPRKPFVFGFSGINEPRKNHALLLQAFAETFGNSSDVLLKIHSRKERYFDNILSLFKKYSCSNIRCEYQEYSRKEYEAFLDSLDCYVSFSKGEGFSIIPREMLARGVPCILTNNTAQKTICDSQCVYSVKSAIIERAPGYIGTYFNCKLSDAKEALKTVYNNYEYYLALANQGRMWVAQYLPENLMPLYINFVKPQKVIFGDKNLITKEYLMTNSEKLFKKYMELGQGSAMKFEGIGKGE